MPLRQEEAKLGKIIFGVDSVNSAFSRSITKRSGFFKTKVLNSILSDRVISKSPCLEKLILLMVTFLASCAKQLVLVSDNKKRANATIKIF